MRAPRTDSDEPRVEILSGKGLSSHSSEIHRVGDEESFNSDDTTELTDDLESSLG